MRYRPIFPIEKSPNRFFELNPTKTTFSAQWLLVFLYLVVKSASSYKIMGRINKMNLRTAAPENLEADCA
jgi:hypothetical protein